MEKIPDPSHKIIQTYNPEWMKLYEQESQNIKQIFGDALLGIEHIGSTSIPNLDAKPIIDIMVLIKNSDQAELFIKPLATIGYTFDETVHNQNPSPERYFFRKGNPTTFHLSIAYTDKGSFWDRQIAFRDFLKNNSRERDEYARLKHLLITQDPTGTDAYIEGKTDLINKILDKSGFKRWKPNNT